MSVWGGLVGQAEAVSVLTKAAADAHLDHPGPAMTHAWLVTGPPGSGRSLAAEAFATALVCGSRGCGTCADCRDSSKRAHPDVAIISPEGLSYGTGDARKLVERAAYSPSRARWHVIVLEDADRLTESANNVLLKSIEEPPPRTVWVLCAPSADDVLATIRSRCRPVRLRTPSTEQVAEHLVAVLGVDGHTALFAARAAQGHVGRARALANDAQARGIRQRLLAVPGRLVSVAACLEVASELIDIARESVVGATDQRDDEERRDMEAAWGHGAQGKGVAGGARGMKGALKDLETRQASRRTRTQRDQLDRMVLDLLSYYRDVLVLQTRTSDDSAGEATELVNLELAVELERAAADMTVGDTLRRMSALESARVALGANVAPQLALEALMIELWKPDLRARLGVTL